jgi:hypothetical protein
MEARPTWQAMTVRRALMLTADNASTPNNDRGYGRLRILDAINYVPVSVDPEAAPAPAARLRVGPNPLVLPAALDLDVPGAGPVAIDIYGPGGRLVGRVAGVATAPGPVRLAWDGRDPRGRALPAGVYLLRATGQALGARAKVVLAP